MNDVHNPPNAQEITYVAEAMAAMEVRYATPPIAFHDPVWDLTPYATRLSRRRVAKVVWTVTDDDGVTGTPCDPSFLDVLKAHCIHRRYTAETASYFVNSARYLWRAIARRLSSTKDSFAWRRVGEADLDLMLDLMREAGMAPTSLYVSESNINFWMEQLYKAGITSMPRRKTRTAPPEPVGNIQEDGTSRPSSRLPDRDAIEALAEVRCREDLSAYDRLLVELSFFCILVGLRGGEALTLLEDCMRRGADGQLRVHFFKEKGRHGKAIDDSVPVYDVWAKDAVQALETIRALTADARRIAQVLERDGIHLPGFSDDDRITGKQVADLTGYGPERVVKWKLKSKIQKNLGRPKKVGEIPGTLRGVHATYRAGEVRKKLITLFERRSAWRLVGEDGTEYPLSRALCCVPFNFGDRRKSVNHLLVEPLRIHDWDNWLNGKYSVFKRLLSDNPRLQAVSLSTHGFRHLHTTLLAKGGATTEDIMRVMRRDGAHKSKQLRAYIGLSQSERVALLEKGMKDGTVIGGVADARSLRPVKEVAFGEDEIFPKNRIVAVHLTPYGSCTHSFGTAPCPKYVACLDNCGDYCVGADDQVARQNLVQLVRRKERSLENAKIAVERGLGPVASEWYEREAGTIARGKAVLAALDAALPGTIVRPFAGMPSKADDPDNRL